MRKLFDAVALKQKEGARRRNRLVDAQAEFEASEYVMAQQSAELSECKTAARAEFQAEAMCRQKNINLETRMDEQRCAEIQACEELREALRLESLQSTYHRDASCCLEQELGRALEVADILKQEIASQQAIIQVESSRSSRLLDQVACLQTQCTAQQGELSDVKEAVEERACQLECQQLNWRGEVKQWMQEEAAQEHCIQELHMQLANEEQMRVKDQAENERLQYLFHTQHNVLAHRSQVIEWLQDQRNQIRAPRVRRSHSVGAQISVKDRSPHKEGKIQFDSRHEQTTYALGWLGNAVHAPWETEAQSLIEASQRHHAPSWDRADKSAIYLQSQSAAICPSSKFLMQARLWNMEGMLAHEEEKSRELCESANKAVAEAKASGAVVEEQAAQVDALRVWRLWLRSKLDVEEIKRDELTTCVAEESSEVQALRDATCEKDSEITALEGCCQRLVAQLHDEERVAAEYMAASHVCHRSSAPSSVRSRPAVNVVDQSSQYSQQVQSMSMALHVVSVEDLEQLTTSFSECLGSGGYGQVFAGTASPSSFQGFHGRVAVKVAATGAVRAEEQFLREVRIGAIQDDNLVPLLAVCLPQLALIYPRADQSLEDRLRGADRPGPADGLQLLLGAARGLQALHSRGLAHRDVKSANVLLFPCEATAQCVARLGDCGWSRDLPEEAVGITVTRVGTLPYLDPEAQSAGIRSRSSDVFAFGVITLEVLLKRSVTEVGRDIRPLWRQLNESLPFACDGATATAAAAVAYIRGAGADTTWHAEPLGQVCSLVTDALKERCTQPRPVDRPTVAALIDRLQAAAALQAPSMAVPAAPTEVAETPSRICTICFEEPIATRLRPCCHSLMCSGCTPTFVGGICPLCRVHIETFDVGIFQSTFAQ